MIYIRNKATQPRLSRLRFCCVNEYHAIVAWFKKGYCRWVRDMFSNCCREQRLSNFDGKSRKTVGNSDFPHTPWNVRLWYPILLARSSAHGKLTTAQPCTRPLSSAGRGRGRFLAGAGTNTRNFCQSGDKTFKNAAGFEKVSFTVDLQTYLWVASNKCVAGRPTKNAESPVKNGFDAVVGTPCGYSISILRAFA